jgi:[protein-PII] uridylyltransferase
MRFDNETSGTCTVLDLEVEDHVGLLHAITRTLAGLGLDIALARVLTEKGAAVDSFYLAEAEGGKIMSAQRLGEIEGRLREEIGELTRAV